MSIAEPKLITIDLDGTLIDSVGDLHVSVNMMQKAVGGPVRSVDEVRNWVGNGIERLVHRALTNSLDKDADPALFPEALTHFQQAYQSCNGKHSSVYPTVLETLQQLQNGDVHLICVTNKAAQFTLPLLKFHAIDHYFAAVVPGDQLAHKKPHPAQLLHAAAAFSVAASDCLHVGDSESDVKAARAAEFAIVCVSYGYNHGVPVRAMQNELAPDIVIDSFGELPACWSASDQSFATHPVSER